MNVIEWFPPKGQLWDQVEYTYTTTRYHLTLNIISYHPMEQTLENLSYSV